jgi:NADH dehydrogenase
VISGDKIVEGAWTAGDVSAVPDLSGGGVGGFCVPNAQHAVRQAKLLAPNLVATLRGQGVKDYFHKNLGAVAGLGIGHGVYQWRNLAIKGFPAWVMHRGYHGLAIPMWERKLRVFTGWAWNWIVKRDLVSIMAVKTPRLAFETYASRPAAAPAAAKAPAAKKAAAPKKAAAKPAAEKKQATKKPAAKTAGKALPKTK